MKISPVPEVNLNSKISSGGFGSVFGDPTNKHNCIKIFNSPLSGESAETLVNLTAIRSWARPSDVELLTSRFAWPIDVFGENGLVHGYSMPLAPQSCYFDLTVVRKETRQPLQLKYLFDGPYWASAAVRSAKPEASVKDRIEIAIDAVDSVNVLHSYGLSYGDVSGNNIVARLGEKPGVFFFDVDSIAPIDSRAKSPLRSPGWETPEDLSPQEIDRSRLAILIVRLLSEDLNAWPDEDLPSLLEPTSAKSLADKLRRGYEKGDSRSFQQINSLLRSLRSADRVRKAAEDARRSGFARRVILEVAGSRTKDMLQLREAAVDHLQKERAIEEARGFERRRMEKRFKSSSNSFRLDILPVTANLRPLRTVDELRELIFEACFDEIGVQFSARGLGTLENSSLACRAVERALIEVGPEKVVVDPGQGEATLSFQWPNSDLVNSAELVISIGKDRTRNILNRPSDGQNFRQVLRVPNGARGRATLTLCAQSPFGTRVSSPLSVETEFRIPPKPVPISPGPSLQSRSPRGGVPQSSFLLVDLEAEERERQVAAAYRRRQKRKRLVFAAVSALLLSVVGVAYISGAFDSLMQSEEIDALAEQAAGVTVKNSILAIETASLGIQADQATLSSSSDGVQWTPIDKVTLSDTVTLVDLSNSPSNFYQVEFLSSGAVLAPSYVVSEIYEGLSEVPRLIIDGNSIRLEWVRADPSPSGVITYFRYRYSSTGQTWGEGTMWRASKDSTRSILRQPSGESFKFELQVVYSDDRTGQWIVVAEP